MKVVDYLIGKAVRLFFTCIILTEIEVITIFVILSSFVQIATRLLRVIA